MTRLFALDQNFPEPIVSALQEFQAHAELKRLREIDSRMPTLDDRQLLLALHRDPAPWDGLITTDSQMARQAPELVALIQTKLTLVIAVASGHNPVRAAGLLFTHLATICERTRSDQPQLWMLRAGVPKGHEPWERLADVAGRQGRTANELLDKHRLSPLELRPKDPR